MPRPLTFVELHISGVEDLFGQFLRSSRFVKHEPLEMKHENWREAGQRQSLVGLGLWKGAGHVVREYQVYIHNIDTMK